MKRLLNHLKKLFEDVGGLGSFHLLRQAERWLSVPLLYALVRPFIFVRAAVNSLFKTSDTATPLPAFLDAWRSVKHARHQRRQNYFNRLLEYFPDRLAGAGWMSRCRIEGLDHVRRAQNNGRPIILAFCHFGPFQLLRFWLRAAGLPVTMLIGGKAGTRRRWRRFTDRYSPFPEIPTALYVDQMRALDDCLAAGQLLGIAIDTPRGKQMLLPLCDGWSFQMPTGAVRLAIRHQTELIPCSIIDEGDWHFRIRFDPPVPREHLTDGADWTDAGKYLLTIMQPQFQARPDQLSPETIRCFRPGPPDAGRQP